MITPGRHHYSWSASLRLVGITTTGRHHYEESSSLVITILLVTFIDVAVFLDHRQRGNRNGFAAVAGGSVSRIRLSCFSPVVSTLVLQVRYSVFRTMTFAPCWHSTPVLRKFHARLAVHEWIPGFHSPGMKHARSPMRAIPDSEFYRRRFSGLECQSRPKGAAKRVVRRQALLGSAADQSRQWHY